MPLLIHWGQDEMDAVSQTTILNAFFGMKMFSWLKIPFNIWLKFVSKG